MVARCESAHRRSMISTVFSPVAWRRGSGI
jgi:hypothetical protein